jgi:diguanylate cyclase (GGDEF)-like protein
MAMDENHLHLLLIEDNPGDARLIREMLREIEDVRFEFTHAECLSAGLEQLAKGNIDIVLLDLSLPDSQGLETCREVRNKTQDVVIIVFTGFDDVETGTKAVQEGAQDYLVKGKVDSNLLMRSMRYALERQRMLMELKSLSITDELTGLYNRRGLSMMGGELLRLGKRMNKSIFLLFTDLDGMKWINDTLGHQEGDRALKDTARILKETFRESDIIARIGGDEFVVLGIANSDTNMEVIKDRFRNKLDTRNTQKDVSYKLSISMGIANYEPESCTSIEKLLVEADKLMYEQKRSRKNL